MSKPKQKKIYDNQKQKYVKPKKDYGALSEAGNKYGKKYVIYVFGIFILATIGAIYLISLIGGVIIGLI